jgi:hypothetical protein
MANAFKTMLNSLITRINNALVFTFDVAGSNIKIDMPDIPHMALGGQSAGGITMVGEHGPELVNLPRGAQVTTAQETRNYNDNKSVVININGAQNPMAIAQQIKDMLARDNLTTNLGFNTGF